MASPLDLPRRMAASVGNSIDAAGELPVFQQKVLEHLVSMDEVMSEHMSSMDQNTARLIELMEPMGQDIKAVRRSLGPSATGQFGQLQESITRLEALVAHIDSRVPDPDAPSPIEKAKDALLGADSGDQNRTKE